MLIYLIIYIPFIFCAWYDFKDTPLEKKKRILWLWVIVFTLFRGLRWEIGTDWQQFFYIYEHSNWNNIFTFARDNWSDKVMDYGYMFINALFKQNGVSYTIFLLVTNFWIMWCFKDFSSRHSKYPILTLIMLMNVGLPFPVRQTISLATAVWSYRFVVERRWRAFFIVSLIAVLIHKGAVIILPFYFLPIILNRYRIKWQYIAFAYGSTFVTAALFASYIREIIMLIGMTDNSMGAYTGAYLSMQQNSMASSMDGFSNSTAGGVSYTIFFVILLWIREKFGSLCNSQVKNFEFFYICYVIAAITDNIIRRSDKDGMAEILGRATTTFDMFPIIFPLIFIWGGQYSKKKPLFFLIFIMYMMYKFWNQIAGSFFSFVYIPYKSVLEI